LKPKPGFNEISDSSVPPLFIGKSNDLIREPRDERNEDHP
jgi:hypothetical protein